MSKLTSVFYTSSSSRCTLHNNSGSGSLLRFHCWFYEYNINDNSNSSNDTDDGDDDDINDIRKHDS